MKAKAIAKLEQVRRQLAQQADFIESYIDEPAEDPGDWGVFSEFLACADGAALGVLVFYSADFLRSRGADSHFDGAFRVGSWDNEPLGITQAGELLVFSDPNGHPRHVGRLWDVLARIVSPDYLSFTGVEDEWWDFVQRNVETLS